MQFEKATKKKAKLRLAITGPSGAGKTFTSLRIASGISDHIGVIDSERGRSEKYADRFSFDVLRLEDRGITSYIEAIDAAKDYPILVVDSTTHAWEELLTEVDRIAKAKFSGNRWSAWSEGTPKQRRFIDAITGFPGHVIVTMRSRTEWLQEKDERTGKIKPVRIGTTPEQGKNIEYEFDILMELSTDHIGTVLIDHTGKFQDAIIEKPGEDFGQSLVAWLNEGAEPQRVQAAPEPPKALLVAKPVLDPFIEMVDREHLDDRAKGQMNEYLIRKAEQIGKDTDTIKKMAMKEQKRFWKGFHEFQAEYDIPQTFPESEHPDQQPDHPSV